MRIFPIIMSVLGLAMAGASILAAQALAGRDVAATAAVQPAQNQTTLLIAAGVDIPFGSEITRDKLVVMDWPSDAIPTGAFIEVADLLGPDGTAPRRALQEMVAGDLIMNEKVSFFGESITISTALEDSHRAMAIKVSAETAVGGFVSPGDRVDIVLTQGRGANLRTGTILQDIRVLGIDQNADASARGAQTARTITVEVTPRDGQKLALSQQAGILSLALRNEMSGHVDPALDQITMKDIWGEAEEEVVVVVPTPVAAIEPERSVVVRRGLSEETVVVE